MEFNITEDGCIENGITLEEAVALYGISLGISGNTRNNIIKSLRKRGCLVISGVEKRVPHTNTYICNYSITRKGNKLLSNIVMSSYKIPQELRERLENLSKQLKEIYPKGKKPGTNYYWTEGPILIIRRLTSFFKKYGTGYTDEQIIEATKKYVEGFNGNYQYMRLLKYFIFKEDLNANNEVEGSSDLVTYIENAGQEDELSNDWTSTLR